MAVVRLVVEVVVVVVAVLLDLFILLLQPDLFDQLAAVLFVVVNVPASEQLVVPFVHWLLWFSSLNPCGIVL